MKRTTVGLIPCCAPKLDHVAPARDLYTSSTFRTQLAAAEAACDVVFILSAKHGLVRSGVPIAPYDVTIDNVAYTVDELAAQAAAVLPADADVYAFLPSKYLALADEALKLIDVYVADVYEDCVWMGRAGGIGEHRHICKVVRDTHATIEGN